jgi:hypothetical protein
MKNEHRKNAAISFIGSNRYTRKSGNNWIIFKHSIHLGMTSIGLIISSRLEIGYGFTSMMQEHLSTSASQPASHVSEFKSKLKRGAASFEI